MTSERQRHWRPVTVPARQRAGLARSNLAARAPIGRASVDDDSRASADGGNDRADELVQWGKEGGPYSRIDRHGKGQGNGRLRPEPTYAARREARLAAKQAEKDAEKESQSESNGKTNDAAAQDTAEDDMFWAALESAELEGLLHHTQRERQSARSSW